MTTKSMPELTGKPSDETPDILATGSPDIGTLFVSMAERHPEGEDAAYLRWHTLDHRPEQMRLQSIKATLRVISTPECRAARAVSTDSFDAIDHVMTYFFTDSDGLDEFVALSDALRDAGRSPFILNPVQRGVYRVENKAAAARAVVGSDVLPWWPAKGMYIIVEEGSATSSELTQVPGVAGVWSAQSQPTSASSAGSGQQITYCFLDEDPIDTAKLLEPVLKQRWQDQAVKPLLAAPFYSIVPYEWDRYLP